MKVKKVLYVPGKIDDKIVKAVVKESKKCRKAEKSLIAFIDRRALVVTYYADHATYEVPIIGEFKEEQIEPNQKFQSIFSEYVKNAEAKAKALLKPYYKNISTWVATKSKEPDKSFEVRFTIMVSQKLF